LAHPSGSPSAIPSSMPTRRTRSPCWARTAMGHANTKPPISPMNSRRSISSPSLKVRTKRVRYCDHNKIRRQCLLGVISAGCAALPVFPLYPLKADIRMVAGARRCGPRTDSMDRTQLIVYSTTLSASASTFGGISSRRAFAVLELSTSSNFAGCMIGRSEGFAPLTILAT
jgi:hypothetical protein